MHIHDGQSFADRIIIHEITFILWKFWLVVSLLQYVVQTFPDTNMYLTRMSMPFMQKETSTLEETSTVA
jgi:hypothetical protein